MFGEHGIFFAHVCSAAAGNAPEGTEKQSQICRQGIKGRWSLPLVTLGSMSSEGDLRKQDLLLICFQPASGTVLASSHAQDRWALYTAFPLTSSQDAVGASRRQCDSCEHLHSDQL